ncbi:cilia- and flagella-associated protein 73-like [Drosophila tropicalis]|uniref:cilia- and flagella-associated protein 73-like n=1 Tax=Drosophila tropicalis TaxID=46794 RepID=UPI0035AB94DF
MPRVKPTKKLDVLGNLDLRPEEAVRDYFISKAQEQFFVKPPKADSAGDSIELLFIHNTREHDAMVELQKEMLDNAKRQTEKNSARVRKMYKIQDRLRKRFISVNSFIKDCMDKKRNAEKTINAEKALHVELSESIEKFKISIDELGTFRAALKATVEEFQPYEKVLDEVVKVSDIFVSPKDCMDRCDALMLAQVEIRDLEEKKLQEIEEMRQQMVKVTNEAALTVLGLKNDLSRLERSYNQSRVLCLKWEKILTNTKDTIANNAMDKERTLDAINMLYRTLCQRRDVLPSIPRSEVEPQLDYIKTEIEVLNAILKEYEAEEEKSGKSRTNTLEDKVEC